MRSFEDVPPQTNELATRVVDACWTVWCATGPGLLESVYREAIAEELRSRGHKVETRVPVGFVYRTLVIPKAYEIDILVDDNLIVETKSADENHPVFAKQLLTYLRLTNRRLGLVANLGNAYFRNGMERVVNNPPLP